MLTLRLAMVSLAVVVAAGGVAGAQAPSKCSNTKTKAAGKKAAAKLGCLSKGLSKGLGTDSTCVAKAEVKFSSAIAKAEAKAPAECLTTGDAAAIEGKVDALVDDIDALVNPATPPGSACDTAKVKAAGKKASAKLGCHAKAISKGLTVDSTCLAKAEVKFASAATKAEAKTPPTCTATGDAGAYETQVDTAVADIITELRPTTTTSTTTTTTVAASTTTTTTLPPGVCPAILTGEPIANTYKLLGVTGSMVCHTNSTANKFGPCSVDADCGGTAGTCMQTPWVTADGITLPFPTGVSTTFTIAAQGASPACSHNVCIGCGNANAACPGLPGCQPPLSGFGCVKTTCCDQPRFIVPTFAIPSVGQCVRVDQIACGVGVVNTSSPQTGDNEVKKSGDTSDPGPDCIYGPGDPAPKPCDSTPSGAGSDTLGKIAKTIGNGSNDSVGIHYRFVTPMMATAWTGDGQGCPPGATYDGAEVGELISTQVLLQAEPTTAGAIGEFVDLGGNTNGTPDGCKKAGAGFSGDGPVTLGNPPLSPMPYGGGPSVAGSAGVALSGGAPLFDLGFVVVLPNAAPTIEAADVCSCSPVAGCPE